MFNRKSIYALNKKDPDAIVYMDANEVIVRLTREDFASEKEFLKWKALSDEDYHASEKEAHVYANHTLALDELSEEAASIPAVDVCMEQAHDRAEAIHRSVRKVTQIYNDQDVRFSVGGGMQQLHHARSEGQRLFLCAGLRKQFQHARPPKFAQRSTAHQHLFTDGQIAFLDFLHKTNRFHISCPPYRFGAKSNPDLYVSGRSCVYPQSFPQSAYRAMLPTPPDDIAFLVLHGGRE